MPQPFYERLKAYYIQVGAVLRGEAAAASIFPNTTDKGFSREQVYAEFLRTHLPSSCNVFFGGFVFNLDGDESKQIDLLVTSDTCPQFNFHNPRGDGKTFACIDGLLAVASIKSMLDSRELIDSLENIASLPCKTPLDSQKKSFLLSIPNYDDWPFKIIYASDGILPETARQTLETFYNSHSHIPISSRPNLIHVAGKYNAVRIEAGGGKTRDGTVLQEHTFHFVTDNTNSSTIDVFALAYAVQNIQKKAVAAAHIMLTYDAILENIPL
jgi:hypothetical protein